MTDEPTTHQPTTGQPARVNDRVVDGPLLDLRDQLVAAAERRSSSTDAADVRPPTDIGSRRRPAVPPWLAAAAVIVLVAVVAVVASLATDDTDVAADVDVERVGNSVTVSIDDDVTPSQIVEALDDAGVDVTVTPQTTGPSLVDRFVGIIGPPGVELTGGDGTSAPAATFTADSKVELLLGVAPDDDADYDVPTDATGSGEPFAGLDLMGRTVGDARADIDRAVGDRIGVEFRTSDGAITSTPDPTGVIANAMSLSPDRVVIVLA